MKKEFGQTMYVYLGLGSNVGDRAANLRAALAALAAVGQTIRLSSVYESAPMYVTEQPRFLNMAVLLQTDLALPELLVAVKRIEADLGRNLGPDALRYGPRPIDIDLLLATSVEQPQTVGDYLTLDLPNLIVPHARLPERAFVLLPLMDLDHHLINSHTGILLSTLLAQLSNQDVVRVGTLDEIP